jgi:arylsulfatase A-like enzyme
VLNSAGYSTGVVGKWHLGLGPDSRADWNGDIKPGPLEIGFDYSFLIPATGDRVPCVYVENHRVMGLDQSDPIKVSFDEPILDEPTGRDHPELLKMKHSNGHDNTIINGVGRIGYMSGGKSARWVDEDIADVITDKAIRFIEGNKDNPFFLYFSTHDIHVPRLPNKRFVGTSGLGPRGDATVQMDWCVGQLLDTLDRLGLADNTLVIFASDNGPVLDDGYQDRAVELLSGHRPAGPLRGGKYSAFEAGTRIPLLVRWPGKVRTGVSDAMFSQVDLFASLAALAGAALPADGAPDSRNALPVLLNKSGEDREYVVEHAVNGTLSIIRDGWKYIEPSDAPGYDQETDIELGYDPEPQLYDLTNDIAERNNLAGDFPDKVAELSSLLQQVRGSTKTRSN